MSPRRKIIFIVLVILLGIGALTGLFWANYRFAKQNLGGNDFLVHWVGTRALLIEGISPYSDAVAIRIQTQAYGRPARPGEHELRVAYPIYSSLIFAPFAVVQDYNTARALWMTLLEVCLFLLSILCVRLTHWNPGLLVITVFLIFSILWYHGMRALVNGNAIILVAFFITGMLLAIRSKFDILAGVLLAFSTVKPQVVVLIVPIVFYWSASQKRWHLILWTSLSLIILTLLGMFLIPDWLIQNLREVIIYPSYNPPGTPGAIFSEWWPDAGRFLGWGLTISLTAILLFEWRAVWGKGFRWLLWCVCLTLTLSQLIGIQTDPGNYIVLILPLVLIFAAIEKSWLHYSGPISIFCMLCLLIGLWALFLATVEYRDQPQQHSIMFFPLPLLLIIGLYWVRRWVIFPAPDTLDTLKDH